MSTGAQWRAEVKAEAARQAKARRQRRGKRKPRSREYEVGPGMVRVNPQSERAAEAGRHSQQEG
jgi:hypothetical protein